MSQAISTMSFSLGLRHAVSAIRRETVQRQSEMQTGLLADPSLVLGGSIGRLSITVADISRLESIVSANDLAGARLNVTQASIGTVKAELELLAGTLGAGVQTTQSKSLVAEAARKSLALFANALNASVNGEFVFGGINSGDPPFSEQAGFDAVTQIDAAFLSYFGFQKTDPAAASIAPADFRNFVDTQVEPIFNGPMWTSSMSSASDNPIRARIGLKNTDAVSVSANEQAIRGAFLVSAIGAAFIDQPLNQEVIQGVVHDTTETAFEVLQQLSDLAAKTGLMQSRVSNATDHMKRLSGIFETTIVKQLAADPYEAGIRLNELLNSLETTIQVSQRIQQMSFVRLSR